MEEFITKEMTIGDVIERYPEVVDILQSFGLHCLGCHINVHESLEQGSLAHGMDEELLDTMIEEANEYLNRYGTREVSSETIGDAIILSDAAADKIKDLIMQQKREGEGLRVSVTPGGCAGFVYDIEFAKQPSDDEMTIEQNGVRIFIDKEIAPEVSGLVIDYIDDLRGSGFKISNPKAKATCGCGKSFR